MSLEKYVKKVVNGVYDSFGKTERKYAAITKESLEDDITRMEPEITHGGEFYLKSNVYDYYENDKTVDEAIYGIYTELFPYVVAQLNVM